MDMFQGGNGRGKRDVYLEDLASRLSSGEIQDIDQIQSAIYELGDEGYRDARRAVEKFLYHEDARLREAAIIAVALDWGLDDHRPTCERFIREESNVDVHRAAVAGLGSLLRSTFDHSAISLMASIVRDPSVNLWTRQTAYSSILNIIGVPPSEHPPLVHDEEELHLCINWDLLKNLERD